MLIMLCLYFVYNSAAADTTKQKCAKKIYKNIYKNMLKAIAERYRLTVGLKCKIICLYIYNMFIVSCESVKS